MSLNRNVLSDRRGGKIALVAHCILNQNSRAQGLARQGGAIEKIVTFLMKKGIGIVQLPCPELAYAGVPRPPHTKEQYDTTRYRSLCRKLAEDIANQVQGYEKCGVRLTLIVGVEGSPTCDTNGASGILMEELHRILGEKGIAAPFLAIDTKHLRHSLDELGKLL